MRLPTADDILEIPDAPRYYYSADMIEAFAPVFDHCPTNHEVTDDLARVGILAPDDEIDSESGAVYVNFHTREQAEAFIVRLRAHLLERQRALRAPDPSEGPSADVEANPRLAAIAAYLQAGDPSALAAHFSTPAAAGRWLSTWLNEK